MNKVEESMLADVLETWFRRVAAAHELVRVLLSTGVFPGVGVLETLAWAADEYQMAVEEVRGELGKAEED